MYYYEISCARCDAVLDIGYHDDEISDGYVTAVKAKHLCPKMVRP